MIELSNLEILLIISTVIGIVVYYYLLSHYGKKIKKRNSIKNIDEEVERVKNFHILAKNYDSTISYNKMKIKPVAETKINTSDWQKTLESIQAQADELSSNNSLEQYLLDNDIDLD